MIFHTLCPWEMVVAPALKQGATFPSTISACFHSPDKQDKFVNEIIFCQKRAENNF